MLKVFEDITIKPISWLKAVVYALCLAFVYYSAFSNMVFYDWAKEDYSHCALIPLVVLYLLWEKRREIGDTPSTPSWTGLAPLGIGVCFFWLGELGGEYFTLYMSFWFAVVGLVWLHLGWEKIKTIWFSLIMMLAMFPFPNFINVRITFQLRLISSQLGVWMLHLYGMSAYREGNVIDLGFTQLQVVDACSGLRYVMPLMVLSLLLAYWFDPCGKTEGSGKREAGSRKSQTEEGRGKDQTEERSGQTEVAQTSSVNASIFNLPSSIFHLVIHWKRVVLFLSSIPLAIFVNSFRIAATGVLYSMFGAEVAEGFFHGFSGWLIFMFAIPCLLLEMWVLRRLPPAERHKSQASSYRSQGEAEAAQVTSHKSQDSNNKTQSAASSGDQYSEAQRDETDSKDPAKTSDLQPATCDKLTCDLRPATGDKLSTTLLQPKFVMAVTVLLLTFGLSHGIEFRQKVPISKPFSQFPMQIGEWKGVREDMEQQFLDVLKFSDYIMANYTDRAGRTVNFYVAYYQDQQKGESIHSPETCLPSSGWDFTEAGNVIIPAGSGTPSMKVNRSFMVKDNTRELVYYWFPQRGRILTNLYQLKIYTFWDSLTRQRTDGALVRVITPVMQSEKLSDAEARLQGFVKEALPILDEYIPK